MKAWWSGLQQRERVLLSFCAAILLAFAYWLMLWRPLMTSRVQLRESITELEQVRAKVLIQADAIMAARVIAAPKPVRSLFALVDSSARQAGLMTSQTRVEPLAEDRVRVTMDAVNFDQMSAWVEGLNRDEGVDISEWSVDRALVPGVVNAAVTLNATR